MKINYTKTEIVPEINKTEAVEIENITNCYFKFRWRNFLFRQWFLGLFVKDKRIENNWFIICQNMAIKIEDRSIEYDAITWQGYFFENKISELYTNCDVTQITEEQFFEELEKFKLILNK